MSSPQKEVPTLAGNWEQFPKDDVVHDQLAALSEYLAGTQTADSCAKHLASTIPKALIDGTTLNDEDDSEDDYDAVYSAIHSLMSNIQHAALQNPQHQPSIIHVIHALKRLPPQTVHAPTLRKHADPGPQDIMWSELPHFTPQITDMYEHAKVLFCQSPRDKAAEWANVNAWIARLVSIDLYGPSGMDYYMHRASYNFLWTLDTKNSANFPYAVRATSNLFKYASPVLLRMSREETECSGPAIGIYSAKEAEKEGEVVFPGLGYSMERWGWWKERWGQVAGEGGEDVSGYARDALAAMEEAETSGA